MDSAAYRLSAFYRSVVDFFYPTYLTGTEFHLYPVGMKSGLCQYPFHNAFRQYSGRLIVLLYNRDVLSRSDIFPLPAVHHQIIPAELFLWNYREVRERDNSGAPIAIVSCIQIF